jgi:hypothetical protein
MVLLLLFPPYWYAPLYVKIKRDALLQVAFNMKQKGNAQLQSVTQLNLYLTTNGVEELQTSKS